VKPRAFILCITFALLWAGAVSGQTVGIANRPNVNVYRQPDGASDILVRLKAGDRVTILAESGGWVQVQIRPLQGFPLTGWSDKRWIQKNTFTMPANKVMTAVVGEDGPEETAASRDEPIISEAGSLALSNDLDFSVRFDYLIHSYKLEVGGSSLFSYDLPGFGFGLDAEYKAWRSQNRRLTVAADFSYEYGIYNIRKLQADTDTEQVAVKSDNSSHSFSVRLPMEYRWNTKRPALRTRLFAGFDYFKFNAKDGNDSAGNPLNVFITQTTKSLSVGGMGGISLPALPGFELRIGLDALVLNAYSEKPAGATGTNPKAGLGLVPWIGVDWTFLTRHQIGVGYSARLQNYSFTGTASRIVTDSVSDGRVTTVNQRFTVAYRFMY
jgi:hypothetical protein